MCNHFLLREKKKNLPCYASQLSNKIYYAKVLIMSVFYFSDQDNYLKNCDTFTYN